MLEVHVPGGGEVGPGGDGRVEGGAGGRAGVITAVRGRFELDWGSAAAAEDGGSDLEIGKLSPPVSALSEVVALGVDELGGDAQVPGGREEGADGAVDAEDGGGPNDVGAPGVDEVAGGRAGVVTAVRNRFGFGCCSGAVAGAGGTEAVFGRVDPPAAGPPELAALGVEELDGDVQFPGGRGEGVHEVVDGGEVLEGAEGVEEVGNPDGIDAPGADATPAGRAAAGGSPGEA